MLVYTLPPPTQDFRRGLYPWCVQLQSESTSVIFRPPSLHLIAHSHIPPDSTCHKDRHPAVGTAHHRHIRADRGASRQVCVPGKTPHCQPPPFEPPTSASSGKVQEGNLQVREESVTFSNFQECRGHTSQLLKVSRLIIISCNFIISP